MFKYKTEIFVSFLVLLIAILIPFAVIERQKDMKEFERCLAKIQLRLNACNELYLQHNHALAGDAAQPSQNLEQQQ